MSTVENRGGKRKGAGRIAPDGRKERIVAYVSQDTFTKMKKRKEGKPFGALFDKIFKRMK